MTEKQGKMDEGERREEKEEKLSKWLTFSGWEEGGGRGSEDRDVIEGDGGGRDGVTSET